MELQFSGQEYRDHLGKDIEVSSDSQHQWKKLD